MNDPDTLPQPPREAFDMTHHENAPQGVEDFEGDATPAEPVTEPETAPETPQRVRRLNVTLAKQLDERVRVMQERNAAFVRELNTLGVSPTSIGLKATLYHAKERAIEIDEMTQQLRDHTRSVRETLESL